MSGVLLTRRLGQKQVLVVDAVRWKVSKTWNPMHRKLIMPFSHPKIPHVFAQSRAQPSQHFPAPRARVTKVRLRYPRLFWQNGKAGLLNRVDFWETVASNIHIYLDDILELDTKLIRLKKGNAVASDVLLCGKGSDAASFDFFRARTSYPPWATPSFQR